MDSTVVVNIQNAFIRFHLHSKYLTLSPSAVSVASNKQKACTKARNVLIFHTVYHRPSERLKNACFEPLFESLKFSLAQLQESVENFLLVVWPCYGYEKVSSSNKLSNAHTLVIIRRLERSQTIFVKKVKSGTEKKSSFNFQFFEGGLFFSIGFDFLTKMVWERSNRRMIARTGALEIL